MTKSKIPTTYKGILARLGEIDSQLYFLNEEYEEIIKNINELIAKGKLDTIQRFNIWSPIDFIAGSTAKMNDASCDMCEKIKELPDEDMKKEELKTYNEDHLIPLSQHSPLREEIGIDERWIIPNNAKIIDKRLKTISGFDSPHVKPDMENYKKLKAFLDSHNLGRMIYEMDAFECPSLYNGHQHPFSCINEPDDHWETLYYNQELGNVLQYEHRDSFEFGYLSNPYAPPIPDGTHRLALMKRKGSTKVLEITVQPVPIKFWHPNCNAWLMKVQFANNV